MSGEIDTQNPYFEVFRTLNASGCPYIVIGGIAVVLHGSNRFTPDVNILLDFRHPQAAAALQALNSLGLKPTPQLSSCNIANPAVRADLLAQGIQLFKLENAALPNFSADVVVVSVGDFDHLQNQSTVCQAYGLSFHICGLQDLINMKKALNRPQDQMDVTNLELIQSIAHCSTAEEAYKFLDETLPEGFDFNYFSNLFDFGKLPAEEKLNWLIQMLAALGGFCMFR